MTIAVASAASSPIEATPDGQVFVPPDPAPIGVGVNLPGFANPAEFRPDACAGHEPFTQRKALPLHLFQTEDGSLGIDINLAVPIESQHFVIYGDGEVEWRTASEWSVTVKTAQRYILSCYDPVTQTTEPDSSEYVWVPLVTEDTIVTALSKYVEAYLDPPVVTFPARDQEFGWLYVNTAQDIRIEPPAGVSLTATVTNVTGTATASISAVPKQIVFTPGEPDGAGVECSISAATAQYSPSVVGCSYRFQHSSAISPTNFFGTRTILVWTVTTSAPSFNPIEILTVSYDAVQVAEIQAVVTL